MATIPDLPKEERPRERLARLGASALSDSELLAIFLRVGVKGCSAIEVGRKLLDKYGNLSELGGLSVKELAQEHGLGPAKAAQLLASFELGIRCSKQQMVRKPMTSCEAIYEAMAPRLAHERNEHVIIILLDSKLRAIRTIDVSKGNADTALCAPRDVLHHVLINQVKTFVLIHNHPSGDPRPSVADITLTTKIKDAAKLMDLRMLDHVIIGRPASHYPNPYYSFSLEGKM